ncbi:molybdate ABC transporter permease subunit [Cytobacillus gottheilii]|uniref:molybdate ABC transporter permease subunit n=1 Tax=Cytobacillus gottheilii TaxID=859144 RepID=UPI0009BA2734|nr:molybdate ABC transporter permease subunit [Cytobacillus gottheilii]
MAIDFWSPVRLSIEIAAVSSVTVIILGTIFAKVLARKKFKGQIVIETLFLLPLVLPPTVIGFLLILFFGRNSPAGQFIEFLFDQPLIFTWWAAVISAVVVSFPLMYQSAKAGFEGIDSDIEGAARVDGAGEIRLFFHVSVPLAGKALMTGAILSFARALGEFGATLMFAGNIPGKTQTTSTAIYLAIDAGNMQMAYLWVACMVGLSFIMLLFIHILKKEHI